MPERAASVPYDPSSSVSPEIGSAARLSVRANPDDFGAQVGKAVEGFGQTGEKLGNQFQGMINETMATNAETQYMADLGQLSGKYKSQEGLAAAAALPQYTQDVAALRQKYRAQLPGGAAHSFDMLALRHEGYAISDANNYSATQIKQADKQSAISQVSMSATQAGTLAVATNDQRFGEVLGDIKHGTMRQLQNEGWDAGTGMQQNPDTGDVSFDESTPNGKNAKAVYQDAIDKATGVAWQNRLHVLADQNVMGAYKTYQDNRAQIPGHAQVELDSFFTPKVRGYQAKGTADQAVNTVDAAYTASTASPEAVKNTNIKSAILGQESGGNPNVKTSIDGAVGQYQIEPGTFKMYAKPGEDINNPKDNKAVGQRILDDYAQKYNNDPKKIAVAYFSGPGNVAPDGSENPWVADKKDGNGQTTSGYVNDVLAKMNGRPTTKADVYRGNYKEVVSAALKQAEIDHPNDIEYADQVRARVEQRMNDTIKQQEMSYKADNDTVYQAFSGLMSNGKRPNSVDEMIAINPNVKSAWDRMQINNPVAAANVENRILTSNSAARDTKEYGSGYWDAFQKVHSGQIKYMSQVYDRMGPNGDISMSGLKQLKEEMENKNPLREQTFKAVRAQIAGKADMYGIPDADAEEQYGHAMKLMYAAEAKEKSENVPEAEMYDPQSPKWIGAVAKPFFKTFDKKIQDINAGTVKAASNSIATHLDNAIPDMNKVLQAHKVPPVEERVANQTTTIVGGNQWIWKDDGKWHQAPSVPLAGSQ